MRYFMTLLTVLILGALAGCKSTPGCEGVADVGDGGKSIPSLRVPVGMAEPNKKEALTVPELNEPERPRADGGKCLDEPPAYFPDRRPGAEANSETRPDGK